MVGERKIYRRKNNCNERSVSLLDSFTEQDIKAISMGKVQFRLFISQIGCDFYFGYNLYQEMYCFSYPFFPFTYDTCMFPFSNTLHLPSPIQDQIQPLPPKEAIKYEGARQTVEEIVLTKEDLQRAGYEISKKLWTQQEDKLLVFLREKKKMDWKQISKKILQRSKKMCYSRYQRLKNSTKIQWLKKDNEKLLRLVQKQGENWAIITLHFKNRNLRQVKEHYNNYLRPGHTLCEWTLDDDLKLIALLNQNGKNWKLIEEGLQGPSLYQIKNRYYGRIKKLNDRKLLHADLELSPEE